MLNEKPNGSIDEIVEFLKDQDAATLPPELKFIVNSYDKDKVITMLLF